MGATFIYADHHTRDYFMYIYCAFLTRFVRLDGGDSLNDSSEKGCSAKNWVTENNINMLKTLSEWTSEPVIGCTHGHHALFTEITESHGVQFSVPRDHIFSWKKKVSQFVLLKFLCERIVTLFFYITIYSGFVYTCPWVNYSDIRVLLNSVELFEFPAFFAIVINLVNRQNNQYPYIFHFKPQIFLLNHTDLFRPCTFIK